MHALYYCVLCSCRSVCECARPSKCFLFFLSLKEDEEYEEPERGLAIRPSRMGLKNVPGMED